MWYGERPRTKSDNSSKLNYRLKTPNTLFHRGSDYMNLAQLIENRGISKAPHSELNKIVHNKVNKNETLKKLQTLHESI